MTSLRQRMIEDMRVRNLAVGTQAIYLRHVSQFARHFGKSPAALGREQIRSFQVYLIQEKKLDPSTITVAVSAIRFLMQGHKIWRKPCQATRTIRRRFGLKSALDYLL